MLRRISPFLREDWQTDSKHDRHCSCCCRRIFCNLSPAICSAKTALFKASVKARITLTTMSGEAGHLEIIRHKGPQLIVEALSEPRARAAAAGADHI